MRPRRSPAPASGADPPTGGAAGADAAPRLAAQVGFLLEADRLKSVLRRGHVADGSRYENSAEHSWTLALMAVVLAEHATEPVDVATVVRMVIIHDLVEVDAGDTYIYDEASQADKDERERRAADRLFGLLPDAQGRELRRLWDEFEAGDSPEARFARSLDRFAGFLLNHASGGASWRENGVTADRVHAINQRIDAGAPALWDEVQRRLSMAVAEGWIDPGPDPQP
ncbi:MAG: HD domain-containing protein [Acidimicrobiales bacterium]|nr:HD domain-containing protein [Acidimicrobiales bacterium]